MAERSRQLRREPEPGEPVSELLPERPTLAAVRTIATDCKACNLYKRGTQTVFGEGPRRAEVMEMRRFVLDLRKVAKEIS